MSASVGDLTETQLTGIPGMDTVLHLNSDLNLETTSEIQVATLMVNLRQSTGTGRGRCAFDYAPSPNIDTKSDAIHGRPL